MSKKIDFFGTLFIGRLSQKMILIKEFLENFGDLDIYSDDGWDTLKQVLYDMPNDQSFLGTKYMFPDCGQPCIVNTNDLRCCGKDRHHHWIIISCVEPGNVYMHRALDIRIVHDSGHYDETYRVYNTMRRTDLITEISLKPLYHGDICNHVSTADINACTLIDMLMLLKISGITKNIEDNYVNSNMEPLIKSVKND